MVYNCRVDRRVATQSDGHRGTLGVGITPHLASLWGFLKYHVISIVRGERQGCKNKSPQLI